MAKTELRELSKEEQELAFQITYLAKAMLLHSLLDEPMDPYDEKARKVINDFVHERVEILKKQGKPDLSRHIFMMGLNTGFHMVFKTDNQKEALKDFLEKAPKIPEGALEQFIRNHEEGKE